MFQNRALAATARNLLIYFLGVSLSVTGALGIAGAIDLWPGIAAVLFCTGIGAVLVVHEYFDGPL